MLDQLVSRFTTFSDNCGMDFRNYFERGELPGCVVEVKSGKLIMIKELCGI